MALLGKMLFHAATRLARDPEARAKAAALLETEIKPRAKQVRQSMRAAAAEANPRREPARFAGALTRHLKNQINRKP